MNRPPVACGPAVSAALVLLAALALTPTPAWAACTTSSATATCTGSDLDSIGYTQSDGIDEIDVKSLTGDVGGATALSLSEQGAEGSGDGDDGSVAFDATVTFAGTNGSDTYGISGATDTSVTVTSTGGAGHGGKEEESYDDVTGGDGGNGAAGGEASFTMIGGFISQTEGDTGIAVSSTGGAGGAGGEGRAEDNEAADNAATGGDGGTGADAGTATLTLTGLSNPDGSDGIEISGVTTGISVASTGGDGGAGGEAFCNGDQTTNPCDAHSGIGGMAAAAGDATATITDTDISITDFSAAGIEVLSTGGTGGQGGTGKIAGFFQVGRIENFPTENDYGKGGAGSDAATASLALDSSAVTTTDTSGQAAYGVNVSSGGGDGGGGNNSEGYGDHPGFGDGGAAGNGGQAKLTLVGSEIVATVSADDAVAVLVASTGGDGGSIGVLSNDNYDNWSNAASDGSTGGDGGDAGSVSVSMDSASVLSVTTTGAGGSMGALTLLSQGGDGGHGTGGGLYGSGYGGAGGKGGRVTGTVTTVVANTSGDDAYGVLLESLGGDGGTGAESDGSGGASDPIDFLIGSASVTTTGSGSHGIVAISQGGDGGDSSNSGDGGDGDFVTLHVDGGSVQVSGEDAYGIAAMSLAGSAGSGSDGDTAGDVKLITGAEVTVSGSNSVGLYAESTGGTTNGTIEVTVDSGGTITASDDALAAISFVNGDSSNTLTNNGTITTDDLTSASIYALMSSGAALAVTNNGTFSGAVDFDLSYTNSFANGSGGTLNLASTFDIGSSGTLTNDGTMSPGGSGTVLTSTVTGVVTQKSDGTYLVDLSGSSTDELVLETAGTALAGTVEVNVITSPSSSSGAIIALSNDGAIDASSLTVSDSAAVDYSLDTSSPYYVKLDWAVDYTGASAASPLSDNAKHFGEQLGGVVSYATANLADGSDERQAFDAFVSGVLNAKTGDELETIYDEHTLDEAGVGVLSAVSGTFAMHDVLHSCPQLAAGPGFFQQQQCLWAQPLGSFTHQDETGSNPGYDETATGLAAGIQTELRGGLFLEVAGEGEGAWVDGSNFSQDGYRLGGGAALKKELGRFELSGTLSGGLYNTDYDRSYSVGPDRFTAKSSPQGRHLAAEARVTALFETLSLYAKPGMAVAVTQTWQDAFTETGDGLLNQHVDAVSKTNVALRPSLEVGTAFDVHGMAATAYLRGGVTAFVTDPDVSVTARFADLGAGFPDMTTTLSQDRVYGELEAGMNVMLSHRVSFGLNAQGTLSANTYSIAGQGRLRIQY